MPNRLARASSPYLLQHADNPVDWYEWGEDAFARAREEAKPVFLSIGYATCHWCHVMAHESFEDEEVAALLNAHFVPVKVDREERPDVDALYMTVCQAVTGHGGWPLTVFLTPEREPFLVGTYFPKHGRGGRPGLMELLPAVARAWTEERERVHRSATRLTEAIRQGLERTRTAGEAPDARTLEAARDALAAQFDPEHGGFGRAPKFPTPTNLLFLLREDARRDDAQALAMTTQTLTAMRLGGIWDHVGFGFHRYATDRHWLLPHFEKMLYDQALLAMAYTEAWQRTREPLFRQTAEEILAYVARDLATPEGAFCSAEDADSANEHGEMEEGAFYVWTVEELLAAGGEDGPFAVELFQATPEGNYREEATGRRTGRNVLHRRLTPAQTAAALGVAPEVQTAREEALRRRLFAARAARPRPLLDDKVLTDWNGLAIAALAKAAWAFDDPTLAARAARAADFVLTTLRTADGRLLHRYRAGEAGLTGLAEDYTFLAWGLLELHQATFAARWLREAVALTDALLAHFWDDEAGGLFLAPHDGEPLPVRQKPYYDGATPSGNGVAAYVLVRLGRLLGDPERERRAEAILRSSPEIRAFPAGHTMAMLALQLLEAPPREVVLAGDPAAPDTRALLDVLRAAWRPEAVVHVRPPEAEDLVALVPFLAAQTMREGRATAYVCQRFACQAPVTDPEALRVALAG